MIVPISNDRGELPLIDKNSPFGEIMQRIMKKTIIDPITNCWLFQGAQNKGQGVINFNYHMVAVSRLSAAYFLGLDLEDKTQQVNHKCSNRTCSNPDHLYIGTQQENICDTMIAGNTRNQYTNATHCKRGHEFTPENTRIKKGGRACKQCERDKYNRL